MNTIIAFFLVGVVLCRLFLDKTRAKKQAYQWWYMPWFAIIWSAIVWLVYYTVDIPYLPFVFKYFQDDYIIEAVYVLLCIVGWLLISLSLRKPSVHERLIDIFRKLFAGKRDDKDSVLPFPYFIDERNVVRSKVGLTFYRCTFRYLTIAITLVYFIFFVLIDLNLLDNFYLVSAFGMLGLLPLLDYHTYLCAEVPAEEENPEGRVISYDESNFDKLWQLYIDTFDNYSIAWKKISSAEDLALAEKWEKDNADDFNNMIENVTDPQEYANAIIENIELVSALLKLEPIFNYVENNGRRILIALDIPNHFTQHQTKTFTEEITDKLAGLIGKELYAYNKKSSQTIFTGSIIVAPLSLLLRQGFHEEWTKSVGLITVVNLFDRGVSNLCECRNFSYILHSVNKSYQVIYITPYRRDMEPSMLNTWVTGAKFDERCMRQFSKGLRQYFISYDFEDFKERFNKILSATPSEPLYSGSELATLALMKKIEEKPKEITPVHFLELAYSNAVEGKEELVKFINLISKRYSISKKDVNDHLSNHLLPIDQITDDQVLSVIYDVDNNVPAIYSKWAHLGKRDTFSIVISKPYLFRDYFNANHDYFVTSPFAALQPCLCKSRLTLAIILLNMLQKTEMEEKKLREILLFYYKEREIVSVPDVIKQLFQTYFSSDLAAKLTTKDEIVFEDGEYRHLLKYNMSQLTDAYTPSYLNVVSVKDESGNVLLDLLYDLMYQNYEEGQLHSFSGRPYRICDFNNTTRTLNVSAVNNSSNDILFYRPVQQIQISSDRTPIEELSSGFRKWHHPVTNEWISVAYEGFETDVRINTTSWYEFHRYTTKDCSTKDCGHNRKYPNGKVLKITFGYMNKTVYHHRINDIRKSLQILLYEAMQSVFPHQAQYLIVSTLGDGDNDLPWIFNRLTISDKEKDGELSFYFTEDAHIDLGLLGALAVNKQNIWYILKYIYDYLIWLTEESISADVATDAAQADVSARIPNAYDRYLERENFDKKTFLKYGRDKLPTYFDIDLLINFIRDLFENGADLQKTNDDRQSKSEIIGSCDFCAKKMKNSEMQRLSDGRMRCPDCSVDAVDSEKVFQQIYAQVKEAFKTHLNIDFNSIPHEVRFVSAMELHKAANYKFSITNGYDVREAIGVAFDASNKEDYFYIENGYKPDEIFATTAHELTHIWQYSDADFIKVRNYNRDWVEGLAVWTDLFLSEKNGRKNINRIRESWLARDDKYGKGLRLIMNLCPDDPYAYIRELAKKL